MTGLSRRQAITSGSAIAALATVPALVQRPADDEALSALWAKYQQARRDINDAQDKEDDFILAQPNWAREVKRKIAGHRCVLMTRDLPEETYEAARGRIGVLETPEYLRAIAEEKAAERRVKALIEVERALESDIVNMPASTIAGVLNKYVFCKMLLGRAVIVAAISPVLPVQSEQVMHAYANRL